MRRSLRGAIPVLSLTLLLSAGDSARAQRRNKEPDTIVIRDGLLMTASEQGTISQGTVVIRKGKIARVGEGRRGSAPLPGVVSIDATGKYVTPGLIDAWTMAGMDPGGPVGGEATFNAADAIDLYATHVFADALRGGVTSVCVDAPGGQGIAGTASFVRIAKPADLRATTTESIFLSVRIGLGVRGPIDRLGEIKSIHDAFEQAAAYREQWDEYQEKLEEYEKKLKAGETVKLKDGDEKKAEKPDERKGPPPGERPRRRRGGPRPRPRDIEKMSDAEFLAWLRDLHVPGENDELVGEAHGEAHDHTAPDADGEKEKPAKDGKKDEKKDGDALTKPEKPAFDANIEILVRALKRELPVRFEAYRPGDIAWALKIIETYHLDASIVGATGAHVLAERVADADVPVVFGQLTGAGGIDRSHTRDFQSTAPAALAVEGVESLVIASGRRGGQAGTQFLTQNAAIAVSGGLDEDAAFRAITIEAARACGVAETLGSLEEGKLADVVIWSGHPMAPDTVVERVFVGGVEVYNRSEN